MIVFHKDVLGFFGRSARLRHASLHCIERSARARRRLRWRPRGCRRGAIHCDRPGCSRCPGPCGPAACSPLSRGFGQLTGPFIWPASFSGVISCRFQPLGRGLCCRSVSLVISHLSEGPPAGLQIDLKHGLSRTHQAVEGCLLRADMAMRWPKGPIPGKLWSCGPKIVEQLDVPPGLRGRRLGHVGERRGTSCLQKCTTTEPVTQKGGYENSCAV